MLLRNFDQQNGHCSRYIIEQILPHLLVAKICNWCHTGHTLLIVTLIASDNIFPFTLRRKQFPVRPFFAMTVNKSQGQSLQHVGVFCSERERFLQPWTILRCCQQSWQIKQTYSILALDEETKKKHHFLSNVIFTGVLT